MSNTDTTLRFSQEGADAIRAELEAIRAALAATPQTVDTLSAALQRLIEVEQKLNQQQRQVANDQSALNLQLGQARAAFAAGQAAAGGYAGVLGLVSLAARSLTNPLVLAAGAVGLLTGATAHYAAQAQAAVREAGTLAALSGLGLKDAQTLAGGFERAGVSVGGLQMMLNRLGFELDQGGDGLLKYGLNLDEIARVAARPGAALQLVRDRISEITDASTRAGAMRELLGRYAGVEGARAFSLPKADMDKFFDAAAKAKDVEEGLVAKSRDLAIAEKELSERTRALALTFAELVAIPVQRWLLGVAEAIARVKTDASDPDAFSSIENFIAAAAAIPTRIAKAADIASRGGTGQFDFGPVASALGAGMIGRQAVQDVLESEAVERRVNEMVRRAAANRARLAEEQKDRPGISPQEARRQTFDETAEIDQRRTRLAGEAQFYAELARLRDDNTAEAVRQQLRLADEEDRLAQAHHDNLLRIKAQEAERTGGAVDPLVVKQLDKQRDDVLIQNAERRKSLLLKLSADEITDERSRLDALIGLEKAAADARVAVIEQSSARRLAVLRSSNQSEIAITLESARIELETARQVTQERLRQNEIETAATQRIMAQKVAAGISTRPEQQQLVTLAVQRIQAEQDMATKVVAARTKMVDDLDRLARREAQIGQQAIDMAQRRLEAEQRAAAGPLRGEAARLQREAEQESMRAERERLGTIEDPTELRNAQRQLRIRELQAQAEAIENQPIYLDQEGIKAALNRMYQAAAAGFARLASGGSILGTPGTGTEGQAPEMEGMRAMAQLRAAMAELGTASPALADLQQLFSGLQGLKEKFVPTSLQGGGAAAAFPDGSGGSVLYGAPPVDSVLARLLAPSGSSGATTLPAAIGGPGPTPQQVYRAPDGTYTNLPGTAGAVPSPAEAPGVVPPQEALDRAGESWRKASDDAKGAGQAMAESLTAFLARIRSAAAEEGPSQRGAVSPGGGSYNRSSFGGPNDGSPGGIGSRPGGAGGGNVSSMGLGGSEGSVAPSGAYVPSQLGTRQTSGGGGSYIGAPGTGYDPMAAVRAADAALRQAQAEVARALDAVAIAEAEAATRIAATEAKYARETNPAARAGEGPSAQPSVQPYAGVPPPVTPGAVTPGSSSGAFPTADVTASMMAAAEKFAAAVEKFASVNPDAKAPTPTPSASPGGGANPLVEGANELGAAYAAAFASATSAAASFIESMRGKLTEAQRDVMEGLYREIKERMYSDMAWDSARK